MIAIRNEDYGEWHFNLDENERGARIGNSNNSETDVPNIEIIDHDNK
jgi:hypothetical protein